MLISKFKKDEDVINLNDLQELIGLKLPSDYVGFLQKYNGGDTPETNWTGKGKSDIVAFYGFRIDNESFDIEKNTNFVFFHELIEKNKLPIAENCSGDYFCLDCTDGSVWFVYHDLPKKQKVAKNFIKFLDGCKSKEIGHIRTIEERTKALYENYKETPSEKRLKGWQEEIDYYSKIKQEEVIL